MSRKERIEVQLTHELAPVFTQVEDESKNHHVPEHAESHFKVTVVSAKFSNLTRIMRHRLVNTLLDAEFALGLHALSLHLYTPEEWETSGQSTMKSPACKDGFLK